MTEGAAGAPDDTGHHATRRGNLFGLIAIIMWAGWAPLMVAAGEMPPFLLLAIAFSSGSFVMLLRRFVQRRGFADLLKTPPLTLALGFAGLWGSNAMFLLAIEAGAAPVPVTIVAHTWPVWMALVVLAAGVARGTIWDLFAFGLGFAGVIAVATRDGSFEFHYGLGIALIGAVLWSLYSGLRTRVPAGPSDALTAFAIVSALVSWVLHFAISDPIDVAPRDFAIAIAVGALPMGIANAFWDIAVRRGDPVLIAGMSFFEPVCATALVLLLLSQAPQPTDMLALVLVLAGLGFGAVSERVRRNRGGRPSVVKLPTGPAGVEDVGTDQPPAGSTQQD